MLAMFAISTPAYAGNHDDSEQIKDPIENVNRAIHGFNGFMDKFLFNPISKTYRVVLPKPVRKGIRNVLSNLSEPVTLINSALQGDIDNSGRSLWRFAINSTAGVGGIFDIAKKAGVNKRKEDFGQTLGKYNVGTGPYIVLPIIGPSNTRDALGLVVDLFSDPFNYVLHEDVVLGRTIVTVLDKKEEFMDFLNGVEETSLDPYATLRSVYTQSRVDEIRNGKVSFE